jgi:hypothetical protein
MLWNVYLTGADLPKAAFAEDPVHAEGVLGDRLSLQPLPLKVPVEVHRPFELREWRAREETLHTPDAFWEYVLGPACNKKKGKKQKKHKWHFLELTLKNIQNTNTVFNSNFELVKL